MTKRIIAITFIFLCTSVAWIVLGGTIFSRTYELGVVSDDRVASTWGAPQNQTPPDASFSTTSKDNVESIESGKKVVKTIEKITVTSLPLESSAINVNLDLQHRQKGLLWYSTYKVVFSGVYSFQNSSTQDQTVDFKFKLPTAQAIYDDLNISIDGAPLAFSN